MWPEAISAQGTTSIAGDRGAQLACCRNHPPAGQAQILHALPQPGHGIVIHCRAELDLDRQDATPFTDEQIDLRPSVRPPEEKLGVNQPERG